MKRKKNLIALVDYRKTSAKINKFKRDLFDILLDHLDSYFIIKSEREIVAGKNRNKKEKMSNVRKRREKNEIEHNYIIEINSTTTWNAWKKNC